VALALASNHGIGEGARPHRTRYRLLATNHEKTLFELMLGQRKIIASPMLPEQGNVMPTILGSICCVWCCVICTRLNSLHVPLQCRPWKRSWDWSPIERIAPNSSVARSLITHTLWETGHVSVSRETSNCQTALDKIITEASPIMISSSR